jgi:hypothetical protein
MDELRERVAVVENEVLKLSNMPIRVERLEFDFSHMKATLEDIRLQGMEQTRKEEAHYDTLHKLIENRIGNVETKQASILTTARVSLLCAGIAWAAVAAWLTVVSPALDKRIESRAPDRYQFLSVDSSSSPASESVIIVDKGVGKRDTDNKQNADQRTETFYQL